MKTILITALMALVLPISALAQSFSQLSTAEQSALAFYNHNGESYAHQKMIKEKLAQAGINQAGINQEKIQGDDNFSQLSASEKHNTVINTLNNGSAFAQKSK